MQIIVTSHLASTESRAPSFIQVLTYGDFRAWACSMLMITKAALIDHWSMSLTNFFYSVEVFTLSSSTSLVAFTRKMILIRLELINSTKVR